MTARAERLLMCAPDWFGVDYVINPWMEHHVGLTHAERAREQWAELRDFLARDAELVFVTPQQGLPDMVFTANAGLELDGKAVVSRFRAPERRGEEPYFRDFFATQGFEIVSWPQEITFEGAGDALLDVSRDILWCGHGFRTDAAAVPLLQTIFGRRTVDLRLVDPRFYHLDTCFSPLSSGHVMYYPAAFDAASRAAIKEVAPPDLRIEVDEADAQRFACNAVEIAGSVVLNDASEALQARLRTAGFTPVLTPLGEFMMSGGAAKCLVLRLGCAGKR
jgi:N-dimethylarginine dimethylaminohydrolase